jgi:chemotaxis protein MotA
MIIQFILSAFLLLSILLLSFALDMGGVGLAGHWIALMIVAGGTLSVAVLVYPWRKLLWTARMVRKAFGPLDKADGTIQSIVHLARNYRQTWDIRQLERQVKDLPPGLLKTGMELIAYQCDRNKMKEVLQQETTSLRGQYENSREMIRQLSQTALSLGLLGTVVNFIRFLGLTRDLQELAGLAAVAFLSLFYGILLAKLGLAPLADRLKETMAEEMFRLDLIQEGILGIQDREHPRAIRFRLETYLAARDPQGSTFPSRETGVMGPGKGVLEGKRMGPILVN